MTAVIMIPISVEGSFVVQLLVREVVLFGSRGCLSSYPFLTWLAIEKLTYSSVRSVLSFLYEAYFGTESKVCNACACTVVDPAKLPYQQATFGISFSIIEAAINN